MGIKERQERDREAVSRAILDAARELFVTEGYRQRVDPEDRREDRIQPRRDLRLLPQQGRHLLCARRRRLPPSPRERRPGHPRRRAREARAARSPHRDLLAPLRVQPRAAAVFRADVRRPIGAAHQPGVRALRVRPRDESAPHRPHPGLHRLGRAALAPQRHRRLPAADDGPVRRGDDAALRSARPGRKRRHAGARRPRRHAARPAIRHRARIHVRRCDVDCLAAETPAAQKVS